MVLPIFIDIWYMDFFITKMLIIMSLSTNIHRPYVPNVYKYMSLVNNSIDQITLYWSILINYPHQNIDKLIKDQFNSIDRLSFQHVGCQATPRTLGNMEYVRTPL